MKKLFHISTVLLAALLSMQCSAATITAAGSGNWSSTTPNAPWPGGTVPMPTDSVVVNSPNNVTVDTNETAVNVSGNGAVTLAPGVTLTITQDGPTVSGTLVATATNCTVNFTGNPYSVASGVYYNLTLSGSYGTLYNYAGTITVMGTMTLAGNTSVQVSGFAWSMGNLVIGATSTFDCSAAAVRVTNNVIVNGILKDGDGQTSSIDDLFGNVTLNASGTWNLGDVVEWGVTGSFTNNGGTVTGTSYATVTMTGNNGLVTGTPISMPVLAITGTTEIAATVNLTHAPTLNGTVVFDLANPGQITSTGTIYYNDTLTVTNSGPALTSGSSFQLFSAPSYNAPYTFATINLPALSAGLSWNNTLTTDGTIAVTGGVTPGAPVLNASLSGNTLTLSWDSVTFPGYGLQAQTNSLSAGLQSNWSSLGGSSPVGVTVDPTKGTVFYRLMHP